MSRFKHLTLATIFVSHLFSILLFFLVYKCKYPNIIPYLFYSAVEGNIPIGIVHCEKKKKGNLLTRSGIPFLPFRLDDLLFLFLNHSRLEKNVLGYNGFKTVILY